MTVTPLRLTAAIAAATALSAVALALPAAADGAEAGTAAIDLTDGTLTWGVKESWRTYVVNTAHGEITAADGAEQAADNGPFTFTGGTGTYDGTTHAVDTSFDGSVRFTSTRHGFDITLADVKLTTQNATTGAITADVTAAGATAQDVEFADLDLTDVRPGGGADGAMTFADIPATLTAEGAEAFNGMYEEGTVLDPATLSVKQAGDDGGTGGTASGGSTGGSGTGGTTGSGGSGSGGGTGGSGGGDQGGTTGTGGSTGAGGTTTGTDGGTTGGSGRPSPQTPGAIVDGRLDWGVKKSFREYVTGPIGHGRIEVSDGATERSGGFRFPDGQGEFDADAPSLDAAFGGTVRFLAHEEDGSYALDLKFGDLKVRADGDGAALVADVSSKDRDSGEVTESDDIAVADLELDPAELTATDDVVHLTDIPAALTEAGAGAFGGFYDPGAALDPVSLAVTLDENAGLPGDDGPAAGGTQSTGGSAATAGTPASVGGTGGSLAATGGGTSATPLAAGAAALTAAGAATLYLTRRRRPTA